MTERKFTDEEVIKALVELKEMSEYTPPICHYQEGVTDTPFCKPFEQFQNSAKIALDLINRQRAEIEGLKGVIAAYEDAARESHKEHVKQQAIIDEILTILRGGQPNDRT